MSYHLYRISEIYSNSNGLIQFIELAVDAHDNESFWQGEEMMVMQGDQTHIYEFPNDLPNRNTANTSVLLATQGFANLGIVTPDFIIPDNFLFTSGSAEIHFEHVDMVSYTSIPLDGIQSIDRNSMASINSPKNFAGITGSIQGQQILGTDKQDTLTGDAFDNTLLGLGNNDILTGLDGNDSLDGGDGIDTAVYSGNRLAYTIHPTQNGLSISGLEGNDTLTQVERLSFQDQHLAFDLAQGYSAGNTVRLIGAAFDVNYLTSEYIAIGLQLFDSGQSLLNVSELIVNSALFKSMIDSNSNTDFVDHIYQNVVGHAPAASDRDFYTKMLQGDGGTLSQAELLILAANSAANETQINLVGLSQTGVEFSY